MKAELSDGQWVELRDIDDLKDADRTAMNAGLELGSTADGRVILPGNYQDIMRAQMYKRIIVNWSFPEPLPAKDATSIGRLSLKQAKQLRDATKDHFKALASDDVDVTAPGTDPTADSGS